MDVACCYKTTYDTSKRVKMVCHRGSNVHCLASELVRHKRRISVNVRGEGISRMYACGGGVYVCMECMRGLIQVIFIVETLLLLLSSPSFHLSSSSIFIYARQSTISQSSGGTTIHEAVIDPSSFTMAMSPSLSLCAATMRSNSFVAACMERARRGPM